MLEGAGALLEYTYSDLMMEEPFRWPLGEPSLGAHLQTTVHC